jgi:AmmeMemoRadiSam system protein A
MTEKLTDEEKLTLLVIARDAIVHATQRRELPSITIEEFSPSLQELGASFVTLHTKKQRKLRGCIGSLEAYQPLILDVQSHAVAAALEDYRLPPVRFEEVENLQIEISRLTAPKVLSYADPGQLPHLLRVGIDGVILKDGFRRATFLPQVWQQLPHPEMFLGQLCSKMGGPSDLWRTKKLEVLTYEVEEFQE